VHISTRNMLSADDVDDYAYFDISNQCIICMLMFEAPDFALNSSHQVKNSRGAEFERSVVTCGGGESRDSSWGACCGALLDQINDAQR